MRKNYRLDDLAPGEILNEMLDLSSELCERSQSAFRLGLAAGDAVKDITVKELEVVKEIEIAIGSARSVLEQTGLIS